jgi:hypothetical protein
VARWLTRVRPGQHPGSAQDPDNVLPTPWHLGTSRTARLAAWYRAAYLAEAKGDQSSRGMSQLPQPQLEVI